MLNNLSEIHVPAPVAVWIDLAVYVLIGLVVVWIVLEMAGYFMRRAYNLTPVGTVRSKDVRPDFLKVDHKQREEVIDRGRKFDEAQNTHIAKARSAAKIGVMVSAILSFSTVALFALGHIKDYDDLWKNVSAWDKLSAIVKSHPVGLVIALVIITVGVFQLVSAYRRQG